jgi:hypothetical protein
MYRYSTASGSKRKVYFETILPEFDTDAAYKRGSQCMICDDPYSRALQIFAMASVRRSPVSTPDADRNDPHAVITR